MDSQLSNHSQRTVSIVQQLNGVFLLISGLGMAIVGFVVLSQIAEALRDNPDHQSSVSKAVLQMIANRWLLLPLILPNVLCGALLLVSRRRGAWRWLMFIAGMLWTLVIFAAILYSFIMFIAPLYEYQPL